MERHAAAPALALLAVAVALAALAVGTPVALAAGYEDSEGCLTCHTDPWTTFPLEDGTELYLEIRGESFADSVHGSMGFTCTTCHSGYEEYPHPETQAQTLREYQLERQQACADCHGEAEEFQQGVHGQAVLQGDPDAPTCTSCHGDPHQLQPTDSAAFRASIPATCATCHGDPELMAAHDVPTGVVDTYLADFHGLTASLLARQEPGKEIPVAVCSDCHDAHEILPSSDPRSPVNAANLAETCGQCHEGVTPSFAQAWTNHKPADPENQPLVYYVNLFYQGLITLSVVGFLAYIALDLSRQTIGRQRGRRL